MEVLAPRSLKRFGSSVGASWGGSGRFVKKIGKKVGRYLAEVPPEVPPPPGEVPPGCSGLHKLVRTHPRRVKRAAGAPAARLRRALQGRPRREVPPRRSSPEVPPGRCLPGGTSPVTGLSPKRPSHRIFLVFFSSRAPLYFTRSASAFFDGP